MQLISCWSVKGGSGTSVVAALLAIAAARVESTVLVDADGDQPAIFGVTSGATGFRDWWQSGVDADALERLAVDISPTLRLIPSGSAIPDAERDFVGIDNSLTIVDAGTIRENGFASHIVEGSEKSLLVLRPCYLAARRASLSSVRIDGMVIVEEQGRSLRAQDISEVVGAPVVATLPWDFSIARMIDAGRLANRVPRAAKVIEDLAKEMRRVG